METSGFLGQERVFVLQNIQRQRGGAYWAQGVRPPNHPFSPPSTDQTLSLRPPNIPCNGTSCSHPPALKPCTQTHLQEGEVRLVHTIVAANVDSAADQGVQRKDATLAIVIGRQGEDDVLDQHCSRGMEDDAGCAGQVGWGCASQKGWWQPA